MNAVPLGRILTRTLNLTRARVTPLVCSAVLTFAALPALPASASDPDWMRECTSVADEDSTPTVTMVRSKDGFSDQQINLGLLERVSYRDANGSDVDYGSLARLSFRFINGAWLPYNQCYDIDETNPDETEALERLLSSVTIKFNVVFRGRKVGELTTGRFQTVKQLREKGNHPFRGVVFSVADATIDEKQIPDYDKPAAEYQNWIGDPAKRPIVLTTGKSYCDPEQWTRIETQRIPEGVNDLLLNYLKRQWAAELALLKKDGIGRNDVSMSPLDKYTKDDFTIAHAYTSSDGSALYGIKFRKDTVIATLQPDNPLEHKIYVVAFNGRKPQLIGDQLELVDMGDYDGDGKAEFIFWRSGYNADGYILCWGRPMTITNGRWIYH